MSFGNTAERRTPYDIINAAAARSSVDVVRLRDNVSVLQGSGGNITVLVAPDAIFMVDTGISVSREKIVERLRGLSNKPIRDVVNTHWHWDHTDGNAWVAETGATLMAHPNTIRHLGETIRIAWGHTFEPVPDIARPTVAVATERRMQLGDETVVIRPYPQGHTDGDLAVYFTRADVLATGDAFLNGKYPFIDYVAGGSIDGAIREAETNVELATDKTIVVAGHGPLGGRADLVEFRDMLVDVRDRVAALKAQGKTLDEVLAAGPTRAYDAKWGTGIFTPAAFTAVVYEGA